MQIKRLNFVLQIFFLLLLGLKTQAMSRYKGQQIKVLSFHDSHATSLKKHIRTFESLTGAKVTFDTVASKMISTKTITDQLAGGSYDLYTVDEPFLPRLKKYLLPLRQWPQTPISQNTLSSLDQFVDVARQSVSVDGQSFGLPIKGSVYLYVYRKDLFTDPKEKLNFAKAYGYPLAPPKTLKQLMDIARFFYRPPYMYGFAPFTKKSEGTTVELLWLLSSFGINIQEITSSSADQKKIVAALKFYKKLVKLSPRGSRSWHHSERMTTYSKGKIVQMLTWPTFLKGLEDPNQSLVVGKNSYSVPPSLEARYSSPYAGVWMISISKRSQNQALASAFANWWASKKVGYLLAKEGLNSARIDIMNDSRLLSSIPYLDALKVNFYQAKIRPKVKEYKWFSHNLSTIFTNFISGQSDVHSSAQRLQAYLLKELKKKKQRPITAYSPRSASNGHKNN